ncbi:MAG: paraquat-inducible protein A, partial [Pandoraea sp.]|nr:paraquat-inducible protein A [Pandoraea sp.]
IGRWSMLDVFVVALMVALVNIQSLAVIQAGPGIVAFGAVVVLTMLASMQFDPRLIWDQIRDDDTEQDDHD